MANSDDHDHEVKLNMSERESEKEEFRNIAYYESLTKKKIANSWSYDQERILQIWAEKASGWAWLHDKTSRYYNNLTDKFTYPAIFLSTISGGIGFAIAGNASCENRFSNYMTFAIGALNVTSAFLSSLHKFVRTSEKSEIHSYLNKQFSTYSRKIVLELSLRHEDRKDCLEFCKNCRDEYDRLISESPIIPTDVIEDFKTEFPSAINKPEIANGLISFSVDKKRKRRLLGLINDNSKNGSESGL
jgi:hypothetical protein